MTALYLERHLNYGLSIELGKGLLWSAHAEAVSGTDILGRRYNRPRLDDGAIIGWDMPEMLGRLVERRDHADALFEIAPGVRG